jgi:hypothetical protein
VKKEEAGIQKEQQKIKEGQKKPAIVCYGGN